MDEKKKSPSNWVLRTVSGFIGGLSFAAVLFLFPSVFRFAALIVILFCLVEFENIAFHFINKKNGCLSKSSSYFLTSNESKTISPPHRYVMLTSYLLCGLSYSIVALLSRLQPNYLALMLAFVLSFLLLFATTIICNYFENQKEISEENFFYFAFLFIGEIWGGFMLSLAITLHFISHKLCFLTLLTVVGADSFAMIIGRPLGKHKLYKELSPKKSWEGLYGGVLLGGLFSFVFLHLLIRPFVPLLAQYIYPEQFASSPFLFAAVCMGVALFGQIGDLTQSWIKRVADLKDSNSDIHLVFFPGHGGTLDRVCGIISACPFMLLIYYTILDK